MTGARFATSSKSIEHTKEYLKKVQERLQGVVIERKDFADLIKVYDRKDALFYLDPPYVGTEKYYKVSYVPEDHQRLADALKKIKGRFILSYNDDPMICSLYDGYTIERVTRKSTLAANGNNKTDFAEIIIRNY